MNLLFWNLGRKDNARLVAEVIKIRHVDIAFFAEHENTKIPDILSKLGDGYAIGPVNGLGCDKLRSVMKASLTSKGNMEETRHSVSCIERGDGHDLLIASTHLPDRRSAPDPSARLLEIGRLMEMVHKMAKEHECHNVIIMGDFNANPYD